MQIVAQYAGLIRLKQTIARYGTLGIGDRHTDIARGDFHHAETIIHALRVAPHPDTSLSGLVTLCEIDFRIDTGAFEAASKLIEDLLEKTEKAPIDVHTPIQLRLRVLIAKSRLFITAHRPQKALSIALRAVSAAHKARALGLLWHSLAMLMHVLRSLKCDELVRDIGHAIVEQTRKLWDQSVLAEVQTALSDAYLDGELKARRESLPKQSKDMSAQAGQWAAELLESTYHEFSSALSIFTNVVTARRRLQNVAAIRQAEAKLDARRNSIAGVGVHTDTKWWDSSAPREEAYISGHKSDQTEEATWDFTESASLTWEELSLPSLRS